MAKKATGKVGKKGGSKTGARAVAKRSGAQESMGDAFIKLLQSPLAAELVAVAATAALAALAEEGFSKSSGAARGKRAGRAVKQAGKAAAEAVKRRLSTEIDEIRTAAKRAKSAAGA